MAQSVLQSVASITPSSIAAKHFDNDSPGNESKCKLCGDVVKDSGNTTNLFKVRCTYWGEGEIPPVYFEAAFAP